MRGINFHHITVERIYFSATVEVFPAQESYEIGTKVTLRCIPPPSFHWRSPYFRWHSTPAVGIPFARSNISFVIPAHSPALVNCYCSVHGGRHPFHYLLGRGRTTLKIKGIVYFIVCKSSRYYKAMLLPDA